jgi:hypothetical protein
MGKAFHAATPATLNAFLPRGNMEQQPVDESPTPTPTPPSEPDALSPAIMAALGLVIEFKKSTILATEKHNAIEGQLWNRAIWMEFGLILAVLLGGFGAATAFALTGQTASAEKVAFALFGFIGGRGFLQIRSLMTPGKGSGGSN